MRKIQYNAGLVFIVLLFFVSGSLYFLSKTGDNNKNNLLQDGKKKQAKFLFETIKTFSNTSYQFCYNYSYWDEMVTFVKKPNPYWAQENIEEPIKNLSISFAWVFDENFNQKYGFDIAVDKKFSKSFLDKEKLKSKFSKNWFNDFWIIQNDVLYHLFSAPIQPSNDTKRKTTPVGWFVLGSAYNSDIISEIKRITNADISVVHSDSIKFVEAEYTKHPFGVYTGLPVKDIDNNIIAYITSFYIDKELEKNLSLLKNALIIIEIMTLLIFIFVITFGLKNIIKPIAILSKSLTETDETKLAPLLLKKNEFGAFSRMMEKFFIQKKHLETEIEIRTQTEEELKEIQVNLEQLVKDRTVELISATNLMQTERDQAKLYLEMAGAIICLLDEKANILLINKMGCDILGYDENDLIGKNWMSFCYDEKTVQSCNLKFNGLMNGSENACNDYHFSLTTSKGEERKLLLNVIFTKNSINERGTILFSGVDITKIKKTENDLIEAIKAAENANKAQAAFFANMSHELRTPLFGIMGYSEMMANGDFGENVKHMSSTIYKGGKRLIETLNKVLNLSKLKADQYELTITEVNINSLIAETVSLFQIDAAAKGLNLSFNEPDFEIIAQTDNSIIRDITNNLIHNAIKFTFYGSINVTLLSDGDNFIIKVKDTGIGIPQESLDLVFEEFRQVSEGYSRSFEGTGLGLAIIKKYLNLFNGKIELNSTINNGSEFIIILPINYKKMNYAN